MTAALSEGPGGTVGEFSREILPASPVAVKGTPFVPSKLAMKRLT